MHQIQQKALELFNLLRSHISTPLPNSPETLQNWLGDVLALSGYPDNPSFRNALATEIMHLPPRSVKAPKAYFVRSIKAAVIRQQTFAFIEEAKQNAQKAREEAGIEKAPKTPLV